MSDTKEKDDVPHNLPVDTAAAGEERLAPDAAVPLVHQAEQPQTEEPLVEAGGDGSDPAMVKQDDPEGGNVAAMEMDTKATAEADEKAGVDAETGGDEKVGAEAEKPGEAANGSIIGNGSVDNAGESAQEADTSEKQAEPQLLSGAESVVVPSVPNEKVAQNESAAVQSVPEGTVVKNDTAASETRVESVEPASDVFTPGAVETVQPAVDTKTDVLPVSETKADARGDAVLAVPAVRKEHAVVHAQTPEVKAAGGELGEDIKNQVTATGEKLNTKEHGMIMSTPVHNGRSKHSFLLDDDDYGNVSGTEEEQVAFMKELENFFRGRSMDFKPPKFYGEGLNCLKLWRSVMRLGGYDKVTSCKLWRQVGESFRPPKTCTTVSWTFRGFYEKALIDYERHKVLGGEVTLPIASQSEPGIENQGSGSGRVRRDAASRAMQGWHSQRLLGNGEVSDPIIRDKTPVSSQNREKQLANIGVLKRKKPSYVDSDVKLPPTKASKTQLDIAVVDIGLPADWVKINVQRTKDCFEVYALVPGLLREEVRVQSDPAGRLVISGEPEHPDNPWGVTPFKKVVSLPSRIDPHQTSAVVTLHGQLFVRVPFEPLE